jgi:hypothetical protein
LALGPEEEEEAVATVDTGDLLEEHRWLEVL